MTSHPQQQSHPFPKPRRAPGEVLTRQEQRGDAVLPPLHRCLHQRRQAPGVSLVHLERRVVVEEVVDDGDVSLTAREKLR